MTAEQQTLDALAASMNDTLEQALIYLRSDRPRTWMHTPAKCEVCAFLARHPKAE